MEIGKRKCPTCNQEIREGNFCERCGAKLKETCNCWVLHKQYNCHQTKCPSKTLIISLAKGTRHV